MMNDRVIIEPYFGGFVLETLTIGMYGEARNAIREYIQNGFDSIEKARATGLLTELEGTIEIEMPEGGDCIIIRDNGTGISSKRAVSTLTRVGASTKDPKQNAGFRGIGRLAGIGFCNVLTFTTKYVSETVATRVTFNGALMRELMSPERGSEITAEELLKRCVTGETFAFDMASAHFFEVRLEGLVEAPEECTNISLMRDFVSQVAPVAYDDNFPFKEEIHKQSRARGIPIDIVQITLSDSVSPKIDVRKNYQKHYEVGNEIERKNVALETIEFESASDGQNWWAWVGYKGASGAYSDALVSGLRMRMKNIQIDGVEIVRDIFQRKANSYIRFQDWTVGEIFVRPSYLVPNARRDGFEETKAWAEMRQELSVVVKKIGANAYKVSSDSSLQLENLTDQAKQTFIELEKLRQAQFRDVERALKLSSEITKIQKKVTKAKKNAGLETIAELQALSADLDDYKTEMISKVTKPPLDLEEIRQQANEELLAELLALFENELEERCFVKVRSLIRDHYGVTSR